MRYGWLLLICLLLDGCASRISRSTLLLTYADFGPQPMAYKVIGPKNYQWDPQTPIPFGEEPVRVVVFRNIDLERVKQHYPVERERGLDYRYLPHAEAMEYLDQKIRENLLTRVTRRLETTRERIREALE